MVVYHIDKEKRTITEYSECKQVINAKNAALDFAYTTLLSFDALQLKLFLIEIGVWADLQPNNLYFYIPTHPCDACLSEELERLSEDISIDMPIVIIAPKPRARNLTAKFSNSSNIHILSYTSHIDEFNDFDFLAHDWIVYFTRGEKDIKDYYVVNSLYPNAIHNYFNKILML